MGRESEMLLFYAWSGLDTAIPVDEAVQPVVVVAKDRTGREIGRSEVTPINP